MVMTGACGQRGRPFARVALSGLLAVVAGLCATPARADAASPLTALVDAAAQRLQVAEPVAAFKWNTHGAIEDEGRVRQELAEVGAFNKTPRPPRASTRITSPGFSAIRSTPPRQSNTAGSPVGR